MLSNKKRDQISLVCHATVGSMMAMMLNPKMRGSAFTWDRFPEMMAGKCRSQVLMSVPVSERMQKEVLDHAEETGREIADRWVKQMQE